MRVGCEWMATDRPVRRVPDVRSLSPMTSTVDRTLLIVGGGRMGEALLGGLLAAGRPASELAVAEVSAPRRQQLGAAHPGVTIAEEVVPCAAAVLAVKPGDVPAAARTVADAGA